MEKKEPSQSNHDLFITMDHYLHQARTHRFYDSSMNRGNSLHFRGDSGGHPSRDPTWSRGCPHCCQGPRPPLYKEALISHLALLSWQAWLAGTKGQAKEWVMLQKPPAFASSLWSHRTILSSIPPPPSPPHPHMQALPLTAHPSACPDVHTSAPTLPLTVEHLGSTPPLK